MNYEEMSDFEVNGYVSMHMHGFSWIEFVDGFASNVKCGNEGSPGFAIVEVSDYCNNASDAWPIMDQYGIATIVESGVICGATNNSQEFYEPLGSVVHSHLNTNAMRAAMIVFLMMQE
ncbi:MAG: phage protein NinX family protein [Shewanella sp.]